LSPPLVVKKPQNRKGNSGKPCEKGGGKKKKSGPQQSSWIALGGGKKRCLKKKKKGVAHLKKEGKGEKMGRGGLLNHNKRKLTKEGGITNRPVKGAVGKTKESCPQSAQQKCARGGD